MTMKIPNESIDREMLLKLLQQMIRIDSTNPGLSADGNGEREIAAFIGDHLSRMGLEVVFQDLGKNRSNVIGVLRGSGGGRSLMLNGHTDTVGIGAMKIAPFDPVFRDDRVYGRGSVDMKGGLAAMIAAVDAVQRARVPLRGDVILAFVADEEGMSIGTERVVDEFTADAAIVCEPTNMEIGITHKGFWWMKVEFFGRAAHGSRPDEGIDAIVKAGKFLGAIDGLVGDLAGRKGHPLLGNPSIHASLISGGKEISTYPDYCCVRLERRTVPGETRDTVAEEVGAVLDVLKKGDDSFRAEFDIYYGREPLEVNGDELIVRTLSQEYSRTLNREPRMPGFPYWTDAGILSAAGIPAILFGPKGEGLHADVEYVEFPSTVQCSEVLANTIAAFCG